MKEKIKVGILGATGMVGQYFIKLLQNHPWFELTCLAASARSAGKTFGQAIAGRWHMEYDLPESVKQLKVIDATDLAGVKNSCRLVFSAVKLDKEAIKSLEAACAAAGLAVVSANSAHRETADVPVLIPEINPHHLEIIPHQRKHYNWHEGLLVVKPNCSLQSYLTPLHALLQAGLSIDKVLITTLQGVSGSGYPGHASFDLIDNTLPLPGEELKSEQEPLKILGSVRDGQILQAEGIRFSAHCNRVAVIHGHTACVSFSLAGKKTSVREIIAAWENYDAVPQQLQLPLAPERPVIYRYEQDRPQPRLDRDADKGMAVTAGRLRSCNVLDYKFSALTHNVLRGAAGGAVLIAELLSAKGFL